MTMKAFKYIAAMCVGQGDGLTAIQISRTVCHGMHAHRDEGVYLMALESALTGNVYVGPPSTSQTAVVDAFCPGRA